MTINEAMFQTATVMALRCATASGEQFVRAAPTLRELKVDVSDCTPLEIAELETVIERAWANRQGRVAITRA
jgi:hypothetical protein